MVCPRCGSALRGDAHLCEPCGWRPAATGLPELHGRGVARRGRDRRAVRARVALAVCLVALPVVTMACHGDSSPAATPTAARTPTARLVTATPTATATETPVRPTPTPVPTATPTPVLPTPVGAGFPTIPVPATSPGREIVDAINRNGPAYSTAVGRLDETVLETVFSGEALDYYTRKVRDLRVAGGRSNDVLLDIQLVSLEPADTTAVVKTKERWRFQSGSTCSLESFDETYRLVKSGALWTVDKTESKQTSAGPC